MATWPFSSDDTSPSYSSDETTEKKELTAWTVSTY